MKMNSADVKTTAASLEHI